MNNNLLTQFPAFAPIDFSFDQDKLRAEIMVSGIFADNQIATSATKHDSIFSGADFSDHENIPYWDGDSPQKNLTKHSVNTFFQVSATSYKDYPDIGEHWQDIGDGRGKLPLWIAYHRPWQFRKDFNLPYLEHVVKSLGLDFVSMVRIVNQHPPSIGLIHKDSGRNLNRSYFEDGGVSITLNVSTGGAKLFFLNSNDVEFTVAEEELKAWHFDDSFLHCTDNVKSERIQIRVYGKHTNYIGKMLMNSAIW